LISRSGHTGLLGINGTAAALNNVILTYEVDASIWKWSPKKMFTVKSVYDHLSRDVVRPQFSKTLARSGGQDSLRRLRFLCDYLNKRPS
jgi:hypothetical protein